MKSVMGTVMTKSSCKRLLMIITVVFLAMFLTNTPAFAMDESALITQLDGLNAHQALALANQWYWEKQPVRTHITSKIELSSRMTMLLLRKEMKISAKLLPKP
jgi:hypothetical protein